MSGYVKEWYASSFFINELSLQIALVVMPRTMKELSWWDALPKVIEPAGDDVELAIFATVSPPGK